jgi:hypothetical protein
MPVLDIDPGQSPEAPGTLSFFEQGADPSTGFQVSSRGVMTGAVSAAYVGALAGTVVTSARVTGDADPRFTLTADGTLAWGDGSGATDVSINRYAAGGLEVSGALRFTNGQLLFGPAGDVNLYWGGAGTLQTDDYLTVANGQSSGDWNVFGTNLTIGTVGGKLRVKEGANATLGRSTLVAGAVTVANTAVTANSEIFAFCQVPGGTPGFLRISARVAGTSFTITSSSGTDTSTVAWFIVEPAP